MADTTCPVNNSILVLRDTIQSGRISHPRSRRMAEEILELLNDIAWGRAGEEHIPAIESLFNELVGDQANEVAIDTGKRIRSTLDEHREVFVSHIETHNCSTGDCVQLAPAPCQMSCPAGLDIPTYVTLIGMGRDAEAVDVIRKDCPFPWVCGLVCTRPCEFMCVRGRIDLPISIKTLKGFAAERAMSAGSYQNPQKAPDRNKKVCIIGAGPGGMSAAYYLTLKGYTAGIIEEQSVAGGMILLGIPRYRLPREIIDREVAMLKELGVSFQFNTRFGRDCSFEELKKELGDNLISLYGIGSYFDLSLPSDWSANDMDLVVIVKSLEKLPKHDWTNVRYDKKTIDKVILWIGYNTIEGYQNKALFEK